MTQLYPLKFKPIYKSKLWGGSKFTTMLGRTDAPVGDCGESWEISCVENNCSTIVNGFLEGNTLDEVIDTYMDDIVGEKVYAVYGNQFPLLIKFLDVNDLLSVQVHPGDEIAMQRHNSLGKTEMWYIVDADPGAELIVGFNKNIDRDTFIEHTAEGSISSLLNKQIAHKDEVYFIPAGRIHSSGKGLLIAEVQQSSDITYRVSDWGRTEPDGSKRELHVAQSLDVLDYNGITDPRSSYTPVENGSAKIVTCNYFTVNVIVLNKLIKKDYTGLQSFVIYMCLEGEVAVKTTGNEDVVVKKGESVLVPACIETLELCPVGNSKILEIHL